ncbi:uncharacterized protein LOC115033536 [Acyrthosiphon pisum]|uniref:MULE transposase domain-containing protein n=1 Tax=Acyrthosiphon pisum TaxID=7029 RepID=A0A8R2NKS0_ACYPI|nr:uncharacterized protein LOC115033536 [Acyrthosiphon pisum]
MPHLSLWDPRDAVLSWTNETCRRVKDTPKAREQSWFKVVFAEASQTQVYFSWKARRDGFYNLNKGIFAEIKAWQISSLKLSTFVLEMKLPTAVSAQLPNPRALKRIIQRVRQIKQIAPANPNSLRFEIPDSFKKTLCGEQFLFFDSADSGNFEDLILIFSTWKNLELLTYSKHWFADGIFSSCPNLFYQLYTIHTIQFSNVIPLVYILLPDKKENTYTTMFRNLKLIKPDLNPSSILIDFEKAVMNSIKTEFPQTKIQGCFFHLSQALWRHIQEYGLQTQYCYDPVFALELKKLAALAFVPIEKVIEY